MLFHNTHLCVRRGGVAGLAHPTLVDSELNSSDLQENQIVLRVETFGFSANNITYGLLGEHPHFRSKPSVVSIDLPPTILLDTSIFSLLRKHPRRHQKPMVLSQFGDSERS